MQTINLNFHKFSATAVLFAKQGEVGRKFKAVITDGTAGYTIPEDSAFSVWFSGASGMGNYTMIGDRSAFAVDGNAVTVELITQMLNNKGTGKLCLYMTKADGTQLGTWNIPYEVEEVPGMGSVVAGQYYPVLEKVAYAAAVSAVMAANPGPAVVCEATGELIGVEDASNWPLKGLHIYGKTTQDGTPTPEAPIDMVNVGESGSIGVDVCGKNLIPPEAITISGDLHIYGWYEGKVLPAGTYTVSIGKKALGMYVDNPSDSSHIFMKYGTTSLTFTLTEATNIRLTFYYEGIEESDKGTVQLEHGDAATAYEPYCGCSLSVSTPNGLPGIPVTSGGNYTDSNGQRWICDEIDFARGVYVQRVGVTVFNGSENWYAGATQSAYRMTTAKLKSVIGAPRTVLCDQFKQTSGDNTWLQKTGISVETDGTITCYHPDYNTSSAAPWLAYLAENPMEVQYVLATPVETPLSVDQLAAFAALHTNKPNTTVYTDSNAGIKLDYIADTKTYIDNKFAELAAAIVANT